MSNIALTPGAMPTFKTLDDYKRFVSDSGIVGKTAAAEAEKGKDGQALKQAKSKLSADQNAISYAALKGAREQALSKLDEANHPQRAQAQALEAQAATLERQAGDVEAQIVQAQNRIAQARSSNNAINDSAWNSPSTGSAAGDLLVGVLQTGVAISNANAIAKLQRQLPTLAEQKAQDETQAMELSAKAGVLAAQPGDPATVQRARDAVAKAQRALDAADAKLKPDADAVKTAQQALDAASADYNNLSKTEDALKDYSARFGALTRLKLDVQQRGWRAQLDSFWSAQGK